ncbi:hypothetical protein V8E54_002281 [Elaphomyces granulatus]
MSHNTDMPDSGTLLSKLPYANNELEMDTSDELDELKIDHFDKLDELLCTVETRDLAAFRRVNFICNVNDNDWDIDGLALRVARLLDALPQLQTLQLDGPRGTGDLLLRAIADSVTSFTALKTVIWGRYRSPLNELLPLWGSHVEHIEVSVAEPVAQSLNRWPVPIHSLKKLNLHYSTIRIGTVEELLRLSPCLELFRYDHRMDAVNKKTWQDCSLLIAALQQVQLTLRELDLSLTLYSSCRDHEVDCFEILPVKGQLGPLQVFSRLHKLKAPIVTLLGWSPGEKPLRLAEVLPRGLTHLGLTEDMLWQCTYEWNKELVLEELNAFLDVWRSVTPDLQAMEFWISWGDAEEAKLRMKCVEAGVLCNFQPYAEGSYSAMGFQWVTMGKT